MAKLLTVLVILVKVLLSNEQEYDFIDDSTGPQQSNDENPSYSYGYGVSDTRTGDVKTVWEAKEGETVKGHYSVIEPDGSMRTVEYSAGPDIGFTAIVNNDGLETAEGSERDVIEDKALRDYDRYYDFSEDGESEIPYRSNDKKRKRQPYDSLFTDYSPVKRPKYPSDLEPSEYTHSFSIKHPHSDYTAEATAQSHVGVNFDPSCNTKNKKEKTKHYAQLADLDFRKQKFPSLTSDSYKNDYDKYVGDASNVDMEKLIYMYKQNNKYKPYKPDDSTVWTSTKYGHLGGSEISQMEESYTDYLPPRPKKKYKPIKNQEFYEPEDLDDYVLVPKKKLKKPSRVVDQYQPEPEEEFDESFEDDRYNNPPRGATHTEVIRKVVKKKKPIINILDIFDI